MEVRRAVVGDEAGIAAVQVLTWRAAYGGIVPDDYLERLSVADRATAWRPTIAELEPPGRTAFVAVEGSELVGFVHAGPSRDPDAGPEVGEVTSIYVRPDRWRSGIGRRLLRSVLDDLEAAGSSRVTLWVLEDNHRARRFYEAAGWRADGCSKQDERDQFTLTELRYVVIEPDE